MINSARRISLSAISVIVVLLVSLIIRFSYFTNDSKNGYNATTWDALGYYMYLPSTFIYGDVKELKWFPAIDKKYGLSGGEFYQGIKLDNGNYTFKYLGGVAVMQSPFFAAGHIIALMSDAPEDGFSWPYQYSILFGAIFWFFIGCFFMRKVLLRYYSEEVTAVTILLLCLASNLLQYVSVDGAMSHVYILPLYSIVIWLTIRWHEEPKRGRALLIGLVCGLATISRPTELIMFFIPLLWGIDESGKLRTKWQLVKLHRNHIFYAVLGGVIGMLPQLLYWKYTTGSFIYNVGSKWYFANPWFRVLFGFEKGWFIYTPIAVFMVLGLFFLKGKPFRKAVITFCILNLWIIMAWSDWRYGASYSARALVQSYPVFALALAEVIRRFYVGKWKLAVIPVGAYLIFVNLFQIGQYNSTVLHFDDMNFRYYKAIYLDADPSPMDYSLLDTGDVINDRDKLKNFEIKSFPTINAVQGQSFMLASANAKDFSKLKYKLTVNSDESYQSANISVKLFDRGSVIKERKFRMAVPKSKPGKMVYEAAFWNELWKLPPDSVQISIETFAQYSGKNAILEIKYYK